MYFGNDTELSLPFKDFSFPDSTEDLTSSIIKFINYMFNNNYLFFTIKKFLYLT